MLAAQPNGKRNEALITYDLELQSEEEKSSPQPQLPNFYATNRDIDRMNPQPAALNLADYPTDQSASQFSCSRSKVTDSYV